MSLVILVPMLGRAHHVEPLVESIRATTPQAHVLFLCTVGDDEVWAEVRRLDLDWMAFNPCDRGDYAKKINAGIAATTDEHIFTGASDLRFHPGWYDACLAALKPGIGVVGTNDLGNRRTATGRASTHMLVCRWYVEEFGTIDEPGKFYHEGYPHEFVDDEAVATARARRAYAHAPDAIVEHLHPLWGKAEWDDTYRAMSERISEGTALFKERSRLWRLK